MASRADAAGGARHLAAVTIDIAAVMKVDKLIG
jgi:hypothetical protein